MDFTAEMIRDVLHALQHPELQAEHVEGGLLKPLEQKEQALDDQPRPRGRHYREDSARPFVLETVGNADGASIDDKLSAADAELYTPARDYIVSATSRVVRRLERAG